MPSTPPPDPGDLPPSPPPPPAPSEPPPPAPAPVLPSPPSKGGATIDDAVAELRELVKINQQQMEVTGKTYQAMIGGTGGAVLTTPAKAEGLFPEHWQGVEGRARRTAAGFQTLKESTKAVLSKSTPGKWMMKKSLEAGSWVKRKIGGLSKAVIGEKATNALTQVADTAMAVVTAFVKIRDATDRWTEQSLAAAKKFADVSGSMAGVLAQREILEMQRNVHRGEATASSAAALVRAEDNRKREEDKIGALLDNITNRLGAFSNNAMAWALRESGLSDIAKKINDWINRELGRPDEKVAELPEIVKGVIELDEKNEDRFQEWMAQARAGGLAAGGVVAPGGAAPVGRLPRP